MLDRDIGRCNRRWQGNVNRAGRRREATRQEAEDEVMAQVDAALARSEALLAGLAPGPSPDGDPR